jgi:ABC-2 type transport system permease protein/lipopolysaccharide transport system permease protein
MWLRLAWLSTRLSYRRTILGPLWITASNALLVVTLGMLYSEILSRDPAVYVPHLCVGLIAWQLVRGTISSACTVFPEAQWLRKQQRLPYSLFVFKMIAQSLIVFVHNLPLLLAVKLIYGVGGGVWGILALLPALVLYVLNALWVGLFFGILVGRLRDLKNVVFSVLHVFFFFTPIIWTPDLLSAKNRYLDFNPFYHYVEIVRAPLLGKPLPDHAWAIVAAITTVGLVASLALFARFRSRIVFWL